MDLIDREELKKLPSVQLFGTVRTVDIDNAQKVDAVPMSVIDEIKVEIEQQAIPYEIDGRGNGKSIRFGLGMALEIIDRKVKEHET